MNIEKLKVGMEIKNYRRMCELFGEKIKAGNSKQAQLLNWKRYFTWDKKGNSFIITNIYDKPFNKINGHYKPIKDTNFLISEDNSFKTGVYMIQLENKVYIGSTVVNFKERYKQHKSNYTSTMEHTYQMLKDGGTFSILYIATSNDSELNVREKEQFYIEKYSNDENFVIINKRNEKKLLNKFSKNRLKSIKVEKNKLDLLINFLKQNDIEYKLI